MSGAGNRIWHPYTQMKTAGEPIHMVRGEGAYLFDDKGLQYIDAVSSWWTNIHGHGHPHIAKAIYEQARQLEQVIFAGFTHTPAEKLAELLLQRIPYHSKVFYTDNGSTAVEVALKMALQYWGNKGQKRNKIIAFKDAYHGDTFGAMSVSARGVFTQPFQSLLFDIVFIDTPGETNAEDVKQQLSAALAGNDIAAFIFEPLVLGSGGMLMYSESVLDQLIQLCKERNVLAIADEVMTGFGRTGKFLATDYCNSRPDIICLSKGITGGFLPFAATTCTQAIYNAFLSDERTKMLFHGHSYTGNPLGCAAGVASLEVFEMENTFANIERIGLQHAAFAQSIAGHAAVKDTRQKGTIIAIEMQTGDGGYLAQVRDKAYKFFISQHIILRPLGNVLYILPPYCITAANLDKIYKAIRRFLDSLSE